MLQPHRRDSTAGGGGGVGATHRRRGPWWRQVQHPWTHGQPATRPRHRPQFQVTYRKGCIKKFIIVIIVIIIN